jgi:hypothetical protein
MIQPPPRFARSSTSETTTQNIMRVGRQSQK